MIIKNNKNDKQKWLAHVPQFAWCKLRPTLEEAHFTNDHVYLLHQFQDSTIFGSPTSLSYWKAKGDKPLTSILM